MALLSVQVASANWYASNERSETFGGWAVIHTPSVAPSRVNVTFSGQYNSITTYAPHWIQAGWAYIYPWHPDTAMRYVETCVNNCEYPPGRYYEEFGTQPWGTDVDYMIEYVSGTANVWCAYVGGVQKKCQGIRAAPTTVIAQSEVVASPSNQLNTLFDPVYYSTGPGVWQVFDQNNFYADFPYRVEISTNWHFRTYRAITRENFLPLILK
jgi:hypothetical protein